jgi:hypothetical protein
VRNAVKLAEKSPAWHFCVRYLLLDSGGTHEYQHPFHVVLPALDEGLVVLLRLGFVNRPEFGGGGLITRIRTY